MGTRILLTYTVMLMIFTSFYDYRDIYKSEPVIHLREDSKYYDEINVLLDNHPQARKSQEHTTEVSVC